MLPKKPPRVGQVGFIYTPPYRVQGISVAGEQTMVQIPEMDVAFDIGLCPRIALASPNIALSHAHMDHVGGLPYYFSQRVFQRMGTGRCYCHTDVAPAVQRMMDSWIDLEQQRTPHEIIPVAPDDQHQIKNNLMLRAIEVSHTVPAMGYAVIEKRSKLKEELRDLPQDRLRELRSRGETITHIMEIPLIAYTGDTELGPFLYRDEFTKARVVIAECTFFDDDHRSRAKVGKHLHVDEIAHLLSVWEAEAVVLVHVTRRTTIEQARTKLADVLKPEDFERVHLLMDHRTNRARYDEQEAMVTDAKAP